MGSRCSRAHVDRKNATTGATRDRRVPAAPTVARPKRPVCPETERVQSRHAVGSRLTRRLKHESAQGFSRLLAWNSGETSPGRRRRTDPGRLVTPASRTSAPAANRETSDPTATTVPAASKPRTLSSPSSVGLKRRILVSTGLTDAAWIRTSKSCGPGAGIGILRSIGLDGSSAGRFSRNPTGRMEPVTLSCWSPELWPEQLAAQCCELGDRGRDVDRGHLGDLMYAASAVIPYLRAKMRSASSSPSALAGRPGSRSTNRESSLDRHSVDRHLQQPRDVVHDHLVGADAGVTARASVGSARLIDTKFASPLTSTRVGKPSRRRVRQ